MLRSFARGSAEPRAQRGAGAQVKSLELACRDPRFPSRNIVVCLLISAERDNTTCRPALVLYGVFWVTTLRLGMCGQITTALKLRAK